MEQIEAMPIALGQEILLVEGFTGSAKARALNQVSILSLLLLHHHNHDHHQLWSSSRPGRRGYLASLRQSKLTLAGCT